MIEYVELFRGTVSQTSAYPREVANSPSRADELLTQTLKSALALADVRVLDHLTVARPDVLSFSNAC